MKKKWFFVAIDFWNYKSRYVAVVEKPSRVCYMFMIMHLST